MLTGANDGVSGRVFLEQVRLLYRGAPESYIATLVNAVLLALIQRQQIEPSIVLSWLVYIFLVTAGLGVLVYSTGNPRHSRARIGMEPALRHWERARRDRIFYSRQPDGKCSSFPLSTLHFDLALMFLDDPIAD